MIGDDLQRTFDRLETSAREFLTAPGVLTAMDLDDRAGQLRRICAARLGDQGLAGRLGELQSAARAADPDLVRALFEEVVREMMGRGLRSRVP